MDAANGQNTTLDIKGVGAPLKRALRGVGITSLEQLDGKSYRELLQLHGVGEKGLARLLIALRESGGEMLDAPTAAELSALQVKVQITQGHTGKTAKDVKTRITDVSPARFVAELEWPKRVIDGEKLLTLFNEVTGSTPKMWGPTMVGYGEVHYKSDSGREGDWFKIGFSPRKAALTFYGLQGAANFNELIGELGKHKLGAGCLYINKLADVDFAVLQKLVAAAWNAPLDSET